jgi:hypothetical protein
VALLECEHRTCSQRALLQKPAQSLVHFGGRKRVHLAVYFHESNSATGHSDYGIIDNTWLLLIRPLFLPENSNQTVTKM